MEKAFVTLKDQAVAIGIGGRKTTSRAGFKFQRLTRVRGYDDGAWPSTIPRPLMRAFQDALEAGSQCKGRRVINGSKMVAAKATPDPNRAAEVRESFGNKTLLSCT